MNSVVKLTIHHLAFTLPVTQNSLSRPPRQKFFEFSPPLQRSGIAMKNMDFSVLIAVGMRKGAKNLMMSNL
jgi:hypothetical protein